MCVCVSKPIPLDLLDPPLCIISIHDRCTTTTVAVLLQIIVSQYGLQTERMRLREILNFTGFASGLIDTLCKVHNYISGEICLGLGISGYIK